MAASLRNNRDFRLLWMSGLFAVLGTQMTALALPLLVLRETGSPVQAGAISTVSVTAVLITMLPGGVMADRVERRRLMRLCDLGSFCAVGALVVAVWSGHVPLPLVLLVAGAGAVIGSLYGPAAFGLMRSVVPPDDMGTATARLQARTSTARLVGPVIGGALFGLHPVLPFLAEAVGLLLSTICVALVRTRSRSEARAGSAFSKTELTAGLSFLWRLPYLRTVLLVFGLGMNFAFGALTFTALTVFSGGGRSGLGGGTVVTFISVGALTGALLAPRLRPERHTWALITATCWFCVASALAMAWVRVPLFAGLLCAACMCLSTVASIGFLSTLLTVTPGDRVGRVQSAAGFLSSLVQPFGPLAGGVLLTAYGSRTTFGAIAGVLAVSAAIVTFAPSARPGPAAPEEPPASDGIPSGPEAADAAAARPVPAAQPVPDATPAQPVPDAPPASATAGGIPTDRTGAGSPRP
ncbi:MFS transporter [Streptomyces sp. NPDC048161]|uniref:MFS transporter n=1 Tax=unclassified Streptomyces TaxID=2593676 RepID=UPI00081B3FDE|nr:MULTISPECIES: MFS transporter [unclassified Streptomyces]MYQ88052.1 MFS transporter [Streptomyces sp. SID4936]SCE51964.1 Predicted arabinose efflux permease, MFS family [Streptomyces sp. DvalAA-43]